MKVLLIEMRVKGKMSHLLPIIADFPLSEIRDQKFGHGLSDLHLKHWMNMVRTDLKSSGRNIASLTLVCVRSRQADPQRINRRYPKE